MSIASKGKPSQTMFVLLEVPGCFSAPVHFLNEVSNEEMTHKYCGEKSCNCDSMLQIFDQQRYLDLRVLD